MVPTVGKGEKELDSNGSLSLSNLCLYMKIYGRGRRYQQGMTLREELKYSYYCFAS